MTIDVQTVTDQVIAKLRGNPKVTGPVTPSTVITDDLGLDSLTIMNFVMEIEDEFDVSVPLDRLAHIRTIDDLARSIVELRA